MVNFTSMTEDDYARISEEAEAYRKEYRESGDFQAGVPICFLGEGTYIFRIYPDRDSKGFIRLIKRAWYHNGIALGEKKLRFWKDERVDKLLQEAKDLGIEKLWNKPLYQYKSREQGYIMAHFFECPTSEYMKAGNSYGTVLNRRQMFALQDWIAELHPEDKRQLLDPNNPAPGIKMQIIKGAKSNVSCGIGGMQRLALPELDFKDSEGNAIEYTGLDQLYITEDDKLSDQDFFDFRNMIGQEMANFKGVALDKSADAYKIGQGPSTAFHASETGKLDTSTQQQPVTHQATAQLTISSNGATPAAEASDIILCRVAEAVKINPKLKDAYANVSFGNKPTRANPYCLSCTYETECTIVTAKNTKAA